MEIKNSRLEWKKMLVVCKILGWKFDLKMGFDDLEFHWGFDPPLVCVIFNLLKMICGCCFHLFLLLACCSSLADTLFYKNYRCLEYFSLSLIGVLIWFMLFRDQSCKREQDHTPINILSFGLVEKD